MTFGRVCVACEACPQPTNPLQGPTSPILCGGIALISILCVYQLGLVVLGYVFLMLCGLGPPAPLSLASRSRPPPDASDPLNPHLWQACLRGPLAPGVSRKRPLLTRRLRRHPRRGPRASAAPTRWPPPCPAVPRGAGGGGATCVPTAIPGAAPGDRCRGGPATALAPRLRAPSGMARRWPWS
jgi:hypothetical protein